MKKTVETLTFPTYMYVCDNSHILQLKNPKEVFTKNTEPFEILVNGKWINGRLSDTRKNLPIPNGWYKYQLRHSDDDNSIPSTIENNVCVNFFGDFYTKENFSLQKYEYKEVEDWNYPE